MAKLHKLENWFFIILSMEDKKMKYMLEQVESEDLLLSSLVTPFTPAGEDLLRGYERLLLMAKYDFSKYADLRIELHKELANKTVDGTYCWLQLLELVQTSLPPEGKEVVANLFSLEMSRTLYILDGSPYTQIIGYLNEGSLLGVHLPGSWVPLSWSDMAGKILQKKKTASSLVRDVKSTMYPTLKEKDIQIKEYNEAMHYAASNLLPFFRKDMFIGMSWSNMDPTLPLGDVREYPVPHWSDMDEVWNGERSYLPGNGVLLSLYNLGRIDGVWMAEECTPWGTHYVIFSFLVSDGTKRKECYGLLIPSRGVSWVYHTTEESTLILLAYEIYLELIGKLDKSKKRRYALQSGFTDEDARTNRTNAGYRILHVGGSRVSVAYPGLPVCTQAPWVGRTSDSQWEWATGKQHVMDVLEGRKLPTARTAGRVKS